MSGMLALLLTATLTVACGSTNTPAASNSPSAGTQETPTAGASPDAAKKPVTIKTSLSEGELSLDLIAEFEAQHENIKIQLETVDDTKLAAMLATGTAPDIIRINGAFETASYVTKGIALDLTDYIENSSIIDKEDLLPIVNVYRFDGKTIGKGPIYGLPKDWSNDYAIFYNKACFDAAGIEVPDPSTVLTWDEVMELAKKLTLSKDGQVVQYGLAATEWGSTHANFNIMMQYIASSGGVISSADNKTMNFDIPQVRSFLELWVDAVQSNVGPNALNNDQTSGGDLFLSDRCAMLINGYWYSGVIRGNTNAQSHLEDFGMLPTPIAASGTRVAATGGATGGIIYKNSPNPEEAWTVFEWFFAGKPADERAKTGWGMPIFQSKLDLIPQETAFDKQVLNVLNDEFNYQNEFLPVNPYLAGGGWNIFDKYFIPLIFGQETIDAAVEGMTRDANIVVTEVINALSN